MEKLGKTTNALNWFEIAVEDMPRATAFYSTIFDVTMHRMDMMGMEMAMFPSEPPTSGGALVKSEYHKPSQTGTLVYLNGNPNLQNVLDRIPAAGGTVITEKMLIDENTGYMAFFIDSEGNRIGIHSNK